MKMPRIIFIDDIKEVEVIGVATNAPCIFCKEVCGECRGVAPDNVVWVFGRGQSLFDLFRKY